MEINRKFKFIFCQSWEHCHGFKLSWKDFFLLWIIFKFIVEKKIMDGKYGLESINCINYCCKLFIIKCFYSERPKK